MEGAKLFARMREIVAEIERLDKEFPSGPDEDAPPRIKELIREGEEVQKALDPLVRETMREKPEKLAEWDQIMHMCDDQEDSPPQKS